MSEYLDFSDESPYSRDMSTSGQPAPAWRIASAEDLGRALAETRAERGLTQQQLADAIGVQRSYLAELETGASVQMIERLLRGFRRMGAEVTVTLPPSTDRGH